MTFSFVRMFCVCAMPRLWKMVSSPMKVEGLRAHVAEEGGEAVVVLLAPLLEGMMMALGALHARAEEELRDVFHLLLLLLHLTIPRDGRVLFEITCGSDDFAHELVVGFVVRDAVANPRVEKIAATREGGLRALVAQQGAPFVGEVFGVFRAVEQSGRSARHACWHLWRP
jgi:hypothetical protein